MALPNLKIESYLEWRNVRVPDPRLAGSPELVYILSHIDVFFAQRRSFFGTLKEWSWLASGGNDASSRLAEALTRDADVGERLITAGIEASVTVDDEEVAWKIAVNFHENVRTDDVPPPVEVAAYEALARALLAWPIPSEAEAAAVVEHPRMRVESFLEYREVYLPDPRLAESRTPIDLGVSVRLKRNRPLFGQVVAATWEAGPDHLSTSLAEWLNAEQGVIDGLIRARIEPQVYVDDEELVWRFTTNLRRNVEPGDAPTPAEVAAYETIARAILAWPIPSAEVDA